MGLRNSILQNTIQAKEEIVLPEGLELVESVTVITNDFYYSSGFYPDDSTSVDVTFQPLQLSSTVTSDYMTVLFNNYYNTETPCFRIITRTRSVSDIGWYLVNCNVNTTTRLEYDSLLRKTRIVYNKQRYEMYVEDTKVTEGEMTNQTPNPESSRELLISLKNSNYLWVRLFELKIYKNNALEMHLVPVRRISDGLYGFCDVVKQTYKINNNFTNI